MDSRMDVAFQALYVDAKAELVAGYEEADRLILSFAVEHGLTNDDVWRLVAEEASARGDDAVEYVAENPLVDPPSSTLVGDLTPLVIEGFNWVLAKWRDRGNDIPQRDGDAPGGSTTSAE